MGSFFSSIWKKLFENETKEYKLLILGLDGAGKTTIMERIQGKENSTTVPTIGYNYADLELKTWSMNNVTLKAWDLSGQKKMRKVWKYYYDSTWGVIFVIDWTDTDRLEVVRDELHFILAAPEL